MMKKLKLGLIVIILCSLIGCNQNDNRRHESGKSIGNVLKVNLSQITRINIRFGDGYLLQVEDADTISEITGILGQITLSKSVNQENGTGYLYYLDLYSGKRVVRFINTLDLNGIIYSDSSGQLGTLNKTVIELGRKTVPNLLEGVK